MNVTKLKVVNFKNISEFYGEFTKGIYLITGENDYGKSNLIKAITTCLTGQRSANILKQGEEKGHVEVEIGDETKTFTLELRFSKANPRGTIYIKDKETGMETSQLSALQKMFQYTDFDAHEFIMMSTTAEGRRKQIGIVKRLLSDEVVKRMEEIDEKLPELESERTNIGRKLKELDGAVKNNPMTDEEIAKYQKEKNIIELTQKVESAIRVNNSIEDDETMMDGIREAYEEFDEKVEYDTSQYDETMLEIEDKILELQKQQAKVKEEKEKYLLRAKDEKVNLEKEIKAYQPREKVDVEGLRKEIGEAQEFNINVQRAKEAKQVREDLKKVVLQREELTGEIKALRDEKEQIVKNSNLPIKGLSIEDDGLYLDGIPFRPGEVSTSQEIDVATRLIMALNPKMKVFKIMNGESIGEEKFKAIVEFAKKNGLQGFVEEMHRGQNEIKVEEYTEK